MSSLILRQERSRDRPDGKSLLFGGLVAIALIAFLLLPGDIASKTHAALHGLCAQRPSHSLRIGDRVLPLDARMTGIYIGAAATGTWLTLAGRLRARGPLPRPVLATLAIFVAAMAFDGFNALLLDLALPRLYEPSNLLRLVTGSLAGTSLGVVVAYLFAISIWQRGEPRRAVVSSSWQLAPPLAISAMLGALALTGLPTLYGPFAAGLMVAAVAVFWALSMSLAALLSNRAWTYRTYGELAPLAAAALIAAIAIVALLAGLRFAAEAFIGLPKLT